MNSVGMMLNRGRQTLRILQRNSTDGHVTSGPTDVSSLKKEVVNLYKNLIYLSREWPTDLRPQIRKAFIKNRDIKDPEEIRKLIARGEYVCREITATYHLRKYRAMKRRYYSDDREKELDEMFKSIGGK